MKTTKFKMTGGGVKTDLSVGLFGSSSIPRYGQKGATAAAMSLVVLALCMVLTSHSKVGGSLAGNRSQFLLASAMALTPPVVRALDRKTLGVKPRRRHHHDSRDGLLSPTTIPKDNKESNVAIGNTEEEQHGTAASGTYAEHQEERYQKHQGQDQNGIPVPVDPVATSWEADTSHERGRVDGHSSSSVGHYSKDNNNKNDDGDYDENWQGRGPNVDGDHKPEDSWSDGSGGSKNSRNTREADIQQDVKEELKRWFENFVSSLSVDLNVNVDIRHSCGIEDTDVKDHDGATRGSSKDDDDHATSDEGRVPGKEYVDRENKASFQRRGHGHTFHLSMSKTIAEIQAMYFNSEGRSMKGDDGARENNGAGHHDNDFLATPKINSAIMDLVETFLASGPRHEDAGNNPFQDKTSTKPKSSPDPEHGVKIASDNSHHPSSSTGQSGKGERQILFDESHASQSREMASEKPNKPTESANEVATNNYREMIGQKQSGPKNAGHRSDRPNKHHDAINRRLDADEPRDGDGRKQSRSGAYTNRSSSWPSRSSQSMAEETSRVNKAKSTVRSVPQGTPQGQQKLIDGMERQTQGSQTENQDPPIGLGLITDDVSPAPTVAGAQETNDDGDNNNNDGQDCTDIVGWHDGEDNDCKSYSSKPDMCVKVGGWLENEDTGHTANTACCVCGGGARKYGGGSYNPTSSPTSSSMPSSSSAPSSIQVPREREILMEFFNATNGEGWTHKGTWGDSSIHHCDWLFIECNDDSVITKIFHKENNLEGTLPPSIYELSHLEELNLTMNEISGELSDDVGNLTTLKRLVLFGNSISGTLPTTLGSLTNLEELYLRSNDIIGTLPTTLGSLTNLEVLHLGSNDMNGTLPSELGKLTSLTYLRLGFGGNSFTGTIPIEWTNLRLPWYDESSGKLTQSLYMNGLSLSGPVPANLIGPIFRDVLYLIKDWGKADGFSGGLSPLDCIDVPNFVDNDDRDCTWYDEAPWDRCPSLLADNEGRGSRRRATSNGVLPAANNDLDYSDQDDPTWSCCACSQRFTPKFRGWFWERDLERDALLDLYADTRGIYSWQNSSGWNDELNSSDYCSWYGVTCMDEFSRVSELNLRHNSLQTNYEFPTSITRLTNLVEVDLSSNPISGYLPTEIARLTLLKRLIISNSGIGGELPSTIGSLDALEELNLSNNRLRRQIPAQIGQLSSLTSLNLHDNRFYGTIPPELGRLRSLTSLNLGDNRLYGTIPQELFQLRSLRQLTLRNQTLIGGRKILGGPLPNDLAELQELRLLDVSHNALTGELPDRLEELPWLEELLLNDNRFEGQIKSELSNIPSLKKLTLDGQLVGEGGVRVSGGSYPLRNFTGFKTPAPLSLCASDVAYDQKANTNFCSPERTALRSLYLSTDGDNWKDNTWWIHEYKTPCDWHGVNCSSLNDLCQTDNTTRRCPQGSERRVTELILRDNGLRGSVPSNIFNLTHLTILELDRNRLTGTMPQGWDNMTNLTVMNLGRNQLSGTFPREVIGLASLRSLELGQNLLTGSIFSNHGATPTSQNRSLQIFDVAGNRLMDNITQVLHNLTSSGALVRINLASNPMVDQYIGGNDEITRPAPPRLCHDPKVVSFDLRDLPAFCPELDFLRKLFEATKKALQWNMSNVNVCNETSWDGVSCDLETMSITGLRLPSRKLSGTVPDSFSQVPNLRAVNLADNDLSGSLPETLWTLEYLEHVNMSKNSLTGKLPAIQARQLVTVNLSKNEIQGRLPNQLGSLDKMSHLDLSSNALTGEIIDELERNPNLEELALKENSFTGKTPHHLCRHTKINFDMYHQYAWCTANLYKATDILWVSAGVLIALYIAIVPWYVIRGWKGEGLGFLKWSGIYTADDEDLSIFAALMAGFQRMCSFVCEAIRWRQALRSRPIPQNSTNNSEVPCQDASSSTTNRRQITEQNVYIFAFMIVVLQVGVAGIAAYVSFSMEIIAVTLALSGLLGCHFSLICWASSIPNNGGQWLFCLSTIIVPPTTLLGLLVQQDRSVMIWKYILMCGILYASWSIPSFVVVHLLRSIWKKESTRSAFLVQKSMAVIYRLCKALVPVLFFAMRAVGSFRRADDRVEGALWFHERHLAGWVSLFEGLVVTLSVVSMEVGLVARISFPDMFGLHVTWSELGAAFSLVVLVGFALILETSVNEFDGTVAKAVVCSFLLGPALQLGCLWSVCREIYHDEHAYRYHRPAGDNVHHGTRSTLEQESESAQVVVDGEATPPIEEASDSSCSETMSETRTDTAPEHKSIKEICKSLNGMKQEQQNIVRKIDDLDREVKSIRDGAR